MTLPKASLFGMDWAAAMHSDVCNELLANAFGTSARSLKYVHGDTTVEAEFDAVSIAAGGSDRLLNLDVRITSLVQNDKALQGVKFPLTVTLQLKTGWVKADAGSGTSSPTLATELSNEKSWYDSALGTVEDWFGEEDKPPAPLPSHSVVDGNGDKLKNPWLVATVEVAFGTVLAVEPAFLHNLILRAFPDPVPSELKPALWQLWYSQAGSVPVCAYLVMAGVDDPPPTSVFDTTLIGQALPTSANSTAIPNHWVLISPELWLGKVARNHMLGTPTGVIDTIATDVDREQLRGGSGPTYYIEMWSKVTATSEALMYSKLMFRNYTPPECSGTVSILDMNGNPNFRYRLMYQHTNTLAPPDDPAALNRPDSGGVVRGYVEKLAETVGMLATPINWPEAVSYTVQQSGWANGPLLSAGLLKVSL